jgi:oligoribonuclease (3'-5' exoribonuclease)
MTMKYVVLDLETTGLSPTNDQILELGAILVDAELEKIAEISYVAHFGSAGLDRVDPFVRGMHTKNGLWLECEGPECLSLEDIDASFSEFLRKHGAEPRSVILAGFSVHFDQNFIKAQLPETAKLLSHRVLDFGGVNSFLVDCGFENLKPADMPHRSLPDCELELAVGLKLREQLIELRAPADANGAPV